MSAMLHGAVVVSAHICAHHQNAPGAAWPHNGARTLRCRGLGVRAWDGGRHLIGDIIWVLLCFEHGDHRPTARMPSDFSSFAGSSLLLPWLTVSA